tara:strand:- start:795 stop:1040 length:246 start_codon:yes stop_codon:yes gene_type:complete
MKTLNEIKEAFKTNKIQTVGYYTFILDGSEMDQWDNKTKQSYKEINVGTIHSNLPNAYQRTTYYNDMEKFENAIKRNLRKQ